MNKTKKGILQTAKVLILLGGLLLAMDLYWEQNQEDPGSAVIPQGAPIGGASPGGFLPSGQDAPPPRAPAGFEPITFSQLANYAYEVDEMGRPTTNSKIPSEVSQLDGTQVAVSGFMIPIEADSEGVHDFVLVRSQLFCCYAKAPQMNEWIYVEMETDQAALPIVDQPITVAGKLSVGETYEGEQVITLYRLSGRQVEAL